MEAAQRGSSLIEALVSLLVLSIGLLGLAQLQARLSLASFHLKASTQAYLLGASRIEQSLALQAADTVGSGATSTTANTPATGFESTHNISLTNRLISTHVRVRWTDPSGPGEIRLETIEKTSPDLADTYLLLTAY